MLTLLMNVLLLAGLLLLLQDRAVRLLYRHARLVLLVEMAVGLLLIAVPR
jgi:hypothetical protein